MKILALLFAAFATAQAADTSRIVSIGTSITETLYALGVGANVVAIDNSSHDYIPQTAKLPLVGAFRTINSEGIVSLKPTLVLATVDVGPPEALIQMKQAGLNVVVIQRNYKLEEVKASVRQIAHLVNREAKGEQLIRSIDSEMAQVKALLGRVHNHPKVIFCGLGANMPGGNISGTNTRISEMIQLSGGVNPVTQFEGFRPLTEEGVIAAAPDIVLMTERSFERAGSIPGVLKLPGIALTPAGKNQHVIPVSDIYFQGFGPGIGKAVHELVLKFFPELRK